MADALDNRGFVLDELHKAHHHYIKVSSAARVNDLGTRCPKHGVVLMISSQHDCIHSSQVVGTMYEVPAAWGKSELVTYQMLAEVRASVPSLCHPHKTINYDQFMCIRPPTSHGSDRMTGSSLTYLSTTFTRYDTAELGDGVRSGRGARGALLLRGLPHERHRQEDGPEASTRLD